MVCDLNATDTNGKVVDVYENKCYLPMVIKTRYRVPPFKQ